LTIWKPDTCECYIEYNGNFNWVQTYQKCRLHQRLKGQNLLDQIFAQNKRFNSQFGRNPTNRQNDIVISSKAQNRLRIQREDLSNFQEDLPHQNFIRRIFRI